MKKIILSVILMTWVFALPETKACTGITLQTADSLPIVARTIEWANQPLTTMLVVVPKGQQQLSMLPDADKHGKPFIAEYGYVGIAVENNAFIMEGINEAGLSAGLFYFPDYGQYMPYDPAYRSSTISDMQFVAWLLSSFATIDDMIAQLDYIRVTGIDPRASTVHWRVTDTSGRQVVLEIINQRFVIYENTLGVLTNSPELTWHLTNLNNYVNLLPGAVRPHTLGTTNLHAFGGGSGLLGLPGDMTPPSRFVRAAFYQTTAPHLATPEQTITQAFHLLNQFDIPIGIQYNAHELVPDMPSATQVTTATDLHNRRFYYRTMYNSTIRCADLKQIDFDRITLQVIPLDTSRVEPITVLEIF